MTQEQIAEDLNIAVETISRIERGKRACSVDFIKVQNYAVININNMIPVPEGEYSLVDVNGTKDPQYRYLMQAESREINRQKNRILKNADIVYKHKLRNGNSTPLAKRKLKYTFFFYGSL